MDSPLKQPAVDLTEEAEECDPHQAGTHPPVCLLKMRNHYHSLPVQRYCSQLQRFAAKACPLTQP